MFDPELLQFDPRQGTTIREPTGQGYGYWAGGAKAVYDPDTGKFYLFYRQRVPLERGQGGWCAIAESNGRSHHCSTAPRLPLVTKAAYLLR